MTKGKELAATTPTPLPPPTMGGGVNEETKIRRPRLMLIQRFVIPIDSGERDCSLNEILQSPCVAFNTNPAAQRKGFRCTIQDSTHWLIYLTQLVLHGRHPKKTESCSDR